MASYLLTWDSTPRDSAEPLAGHCERGGNRKLPVRSFRVPTGNPLLQTFRRHILTRPTKASRDILFLQAELVLMREPAYARQWFGALLLLYEH